MVVWEEKEMVKNIYQRMIIVLKFCTPTFLTNWHMQIDPDQTALSYSTKCFLKHVSRNKI